MIKLTIAITMYNAEKTIARCLSSIISSKNKNYEVLIVNDGSTDSSLDICKKFAKSNNNISLFSKTNEGVAVARNLAISKARGEYIWFVDSDDWIQEEAICYIIDNLIYFNPDYYQVGHYRVNKYVHYQNKYDGKIVEISRNQIWEKFFIQEIDSFACSHIIRKSVYTENDIYFPNGRIFEDTAIIHKLLANSEKIYLDNNKLYYYMISTTSLSNSLNTKKINDLLYVIQMRDVYLKDTISSEDNILYKFYIGYSLNNYIQILVFIYELLEKSKDFNELTKVKKKVREIIDIFEKQINILDYWKYCRESKVSMFKYYVLYKSHMLKIALKIKEMI